MVEAKPAVRYFLPDERLLVSIGNIDYSGLRQDAEYAEYGDLPEVRDDIQLMERGLKGYGLNRADIMKEQDADYDTMKDLLDGARHKIITNHARGLKTLVIIHYGGHGVMFGNVTHAVVNDHRQPIYPIETMCRSLSKVEGGYVIALLDCCRARCEQEKFRGGPS